MLSRRKTRPSVNHVDDTPDTAWPRMCELQAAAWERLASRATTEEQREHAWLRVEVWTVHAHDAHARGSSWVSPATGWPVTTHLPRAGCPELSGR